MLTRELMIDAELELKDVTDSFYKILKQFAPFGPGNMNPVFVTYNVYDSSYSRVVGNNHLKLSLVQENNKLVYDGIAFQMGQFYQAIAEKKPFHICYHIDVNNYNNKTTLQLNIKDIKLEI